MPTLSAFADEVAEDFISQIKYLCQEKVGFIYISAGASGHP